MKHFIVDITFTSPLEKIDAILPKHREFLQTGYDKGLLLMSGPKNPRVGGVVVARAGSLEDIINFFSNDPYKLNGVADYNFTEFNPVKHQDFLKEWI
jgi:uncharacterized protein YciI